MVFSKFLEKTKSKVLVIGDTMIDHYIHGKCNRISPEAPVPVFEISSNYYMLGGASNVAKNIIKLGVNCDLISVIGNDENGKKIKNLLQNEGINTDFVFTEENRVTTCKKRVIATSQQLLRIDEESHHFINSNSEEKIISLIKNNIQNYQLVLISDYLKGVISQYLSKKIIEICNNKNIKVLVDPKGLNFSKYSNAFLVKPNTKELEEYLGFKLNNISDISLGSIRLKNNINIKNVITTLGDNGILLTDENQYHIKTYCQNVYDVSGAGDTVLATIAVCLLKNISLFNACVLANSAASIVINKFGSNAPTIDEIILNIKKHEEHFNFRN